MKYIKWPFRIAGRRVIKTALAVFLTSFICQLLDWPAVFAVITAIITIEPTVASSIKKGLIRFPASAIGSGYAVLFIYFFEDSPLTYTLAALCTIITCYRLGLHVGLLVATLTSVAMIEVIHTNLLFSFIIRLGTTTIGLIVSTLVNMFVLPPNYTKTISTNLEGLLKKTGEELEMIMKQLIMKDGMTNKREIEKRFADLRVTLNKTEKLLEFQEGEAKYHHLDTETKKLFAQEKRALTQFRLVHYHIGNLLNTPINSVCWSRSECQDIVKMVETLVSFMKHPDDYKASAYRQQVKVLMNQFWESKRPQNKTEGSLFTPEIIILYELLSIYNLIEEILKKKDQI
ncbi:aromatic acid exporter family protein [Gracilibacillus sp. YIM 98692]|uniref:FUSC family protein n=1 Tax=Gracilibacillus sp. YIM 98692 TaxID=2663532 RepID=UPI0013D616BD|nr:aromatic acid exporter family protein [Gracilibacillus sp. YIM 98692]